MERKMFCMQCEQTLGGTACLTSGVCGKTADTAQLQDALTGALITAVQKGAEVSDELLLEALFSTLTNVNFDDAVLEGITVEVRRLYDNEPLDSEPFDSEPLDDEPFDSEPLFNLNDVWDADEDIRSLKTLLLLGIRGVGAYVYHALVLGYDVTEITGFIRKGLAAIGEPGYGLNELLPLAMECGKANLTALELLDAANTTAFGTPVPTGVSRSIEAGP
ncbi:MAG: hydroxylamine reductase, partial [Coriobacteriia bacterium]|nr:hydroxylamine reductase [Coriobacteriia bacterium]